MKLLGTLTLLLMVTACGKDVKVSTDNTPPDRTPKYIHDTLGTIPIDTAYSDLPDEVIEILSRYGSSNIGGEPKVIVVGKGDPLNGACNVDRVDITLTFTKGKLTEAKDSCK